MPLIGITWLAFAGYAAWAAGTALVCAAVQYGLRALMAPEPPGQHPSSVRIQDFRSITKDNVAPARVVYGQTMVSGVLAYVEVVDWNGNLATDPAHAYYANVLHMILAMAEGTIAGITNITLNNTLITDTKFTNYAAALTFNGSDDQPAVFPQIKMPDGSVLKAPYSWNPSFRFRGVAGLYAVLWYRTDSGHNASSAFGAPNAAPNIIALVRGRLLYDPREPSCDLYSPDTHVWSDNPSLCILDYCVNSRYGMGIDPDDIDLDSFALSANHCDELVPVPQTMNSDGTPFTAGVTQTLSTLRYSFGPEDTSLVLNDPSLFAGADSFPPSGLILIDTEWIRYTTQSGWTLSGLTRGVNSYGDGAAHAAGSYVTLLVIPTAQRRFTCNGIFETSSSSADIMTSLLSSCAGALMFQDGKYVLAVGVARPTVASLTEDDLSADLQVVPQPSRKDRINTVKGTFVNPAKNYQQDAFAPVAIPAYLAEDGNEELAAQVDLPFTQDPYMAQRLALIQLHRSRLPNQVTFPANLRGLNLHVWDVVNLSISIPDPANPPERLPFWTEKQFLIDDIKINANGGADLSLSQWDNSIFDAKPEDLTPIVVPAGSDLPDPSVNAPPSAVTVEEVVSVLPGGTHHAALVVTIAPPAIQMLIGGYCVRWTNNTAGGTLWNQRILGPADNQMELLGPALGWYTFEVNTINQLGAYSGPTVATGQVTYLTAPPPPPTGFEAQVGTQSRVMFVWSTANEPPDVLGYELRWAPGSLGSSPEAEWDSASPLGTATASPFASDAFTGGGTFTAYLRAVDTTDEESTTVWAVFTVLPAQSGVIYYSQEASALGWPGTVIGVRSGTILEANDQGTWADLPAKWAAWTSWADVPSQLVYIGPEIDLGSDRTFQALGEAVCVGRPTYFVRTKPAGGLYSEWAPAPCLLTGFMVGRFAQFKFVVDPDGSTTRPQLSQARMTCLSQPLDVPILSVRPATFTNQQGVSRAEQSRWDWDGGQHRNTVVLPGGGLQCGPAGLEFTGSDQYAAAPDGPGNRLDGLWTIEAVIRPSTTSQITNVIFKGLGGWALVYRDGAIFLHDTVGLLSYDMPLTDTFALTHVAIVCDQHTLTFYRDGESIIVVAVPPDWSLLDATVHGTSDFHISDSGANAFLGVIQQVRLWGRALSQEEVRAGICSQVPSGSAGLLADYRCDETSGSSVLDHSQYANTATVHGTPNRIRVANRQSPPMPLGMIASMVGTRSIAWDVTCPANTSIQLQIALVDHWYDPPSWAAWTIDISQSNRDSNFAMGGLLAGADLRDKYLYLRVALRADDPTLSPQLNSLTAAFATANKPADFTIIPQFIPAGADQPTARLASIDQAILTAAYNAGGAQVDPAVVFSDPVGVRIQTSGPIPDDFELDLLIRGQQAGT